MTIETGALEQAYVDEEASYNPASPGALAAGDGIRHLELTLTKKNNREPSPEKRGTPDVNQSLPRRKSYAWDLAAIMWEPSGTLGTISNVGKLFDGGMGSAHTISGGLATTVNAAPAPTTTGATLIAVTGLQVGDLMVFTVASGARREITKILTINTLAVTYNALSVAPDAPGAAVSGITFSLASNITKSYAIYKYHLAGSFRQANYGCVVNRIQIVFDGTREVSLAFSGPAGDYADSSTGGGTVQAKPGSHTTVGAPVSGMVGNFLVDGNLFPVISCTITIENNIELRNKELGTSTASGIAGRASKRLVNVSVTFYLEDTRLIGMSHSVTRGVLRLLAGNTNGSMVGALMPAVEFEVPEIGSEEGPKEVTIEGMAYAGSAGNDSLTLAEI